MTPFAPFAHTSLRVVLDRARASAMKPIDRGDAPPFDLALFAADAVVPKDQRLALDRVPGWFSNAGEEVGAMRRRGRLERRARSERRPRACARVSMD